jgi:hypothetical protein
MKLSNLILDHIYGNGNGFISDKFGELVVGLRNDGVQLEN